MSAVSAVDLLLIDSVFDMGGGYVLNFSDRTFTQFFQSELGINIDAALYARNGTSKGKRLRCFLQTVDAAIAARTLTALWNYREALREHDGREETIPNAGPRLSALIVRLGGRPIAQQAPAPTPPPSASPKGIDRSRSAALMQDLLTLAKLDPHPRGFAFERFLKATFDAYGLQAREPFRNRGEQIDGSFLLGHETYLLEAKWENKPVPAESLRSYNGKVTEKIAWARGLFISYSGFSEVGLSAFGGKAIICMDGRDLAEALARELPIDEVLNRKARRAVETGSMMVRVDELF